jgi:glycosyltransferase involved in cell wall biosynthesis
MEAREARIIARLARLLADGTNWSLSARVDSSAGINIYMPYLNRINARCETREIAWYTHRDESLPEKVKVWYHTARAVDLRVTSARLYLADLAHYGPTSLVTPPLDREKFALAPHRRGSGAKPVVGTSGWVYAWGRKGESLLASLTQTPTGLGCSWRAAGGGWPIPTQTYHWHRLHEFYQALDCYVCTSTIEGIGYGPLEALATGVPVVVPWKVGIFDDLPERSGVRHYRAGSLADLERALALCLEDRAEPEELRALTEGYTLDAWVGGWQRAVDEVMGKVDPETVPSALEAPAVAPLFGVASAPDPGAFTSCRPRAGHTDIHIVLPDFEHATAILPRKARTLQQATGWSLSPEPDRHALVNYFFPYMAHEPCGTLTAAYFTHREDQAGWPEKAARWDDVAGQLELRLTSSRHNLPHLERFGSTRIVRPPLDRKKFRPAARETHARPVVGTSGFVSPWGRKGDNLLAALVETEAGKASEWRAAGKGWPVPTVDYAWREMETFYQGLDLYISTSLIEGTGYGPLEALACGVPVVVPRGVGVWDDLPDTPGITRYEKGDPASLEVALALALETKSDPDALRAATEPYSIEAWAEGHRMAIEELLTGTHAPAQDDLPDWRGHSGLYVVAFGESARKVARRCIGSFKLRMPGVPVLLCSDRPLGPEDSLLVQPDADIGARSPKVRIYDLTPPEWRYVLYLDADTEVLRPIDSLFQWLQDGWELAICSNPGRFAVAEQMGRADNTGECRETFDLWGTDQMMQLGGGVFAFRRTPAIERLFHDWAREWERFGKRDQGALLRAIWHQPVKTLLLLPRTWNCVCQADEKRPGQWKYPYDDPSGAAIMHYPMMARRWSGIVPQRSDTPEAWARVREWERAHPQAVKA